MYDIDPKYRIPVEEIGCPGCGRKYGHHGTKVDLKSQECSSCAKKFHKPEDLELVDAKTFIEEILGIKPFY